MGALTGYDVLVVLVPTKPGDPGVAPEKAAKDLCEFVARKVSIALHTEGVRVGQAGEIQNLTDPVWVKPDLTDFVVSQTS